MSRSPRSSGGSRRSSRAGLAVGAGALGLLVGRAPALAIDDEGLLLSGGRPARRA